MSIHEFDNSNSSSSSSSSKINQPTIRKRTLPASNGVHGDDRKCDITKSNKVSNNTCSSIRTDSNFDEEGIELFIPMSRYSENDSDEDIDESNDRNRNKYEDKDIDVTVVDSLSEDQPFEQRRSSRSNSSTFVEDVLLFDSLHTDDVESDEIVCESNADTLRYFDKLSKFENDCNGREQTQRLKVGQKQSLSESADNHQTTIRVTPQSSLDALIAGDKFNMKFISFVPTFIIDEYHRSSIKEGMQHE